jgi:hypothetical protein
MSPASLSEHVNRPHGPPISSPGCPAG